MNNTDSLESFQQQAEIATEAQNWLEAAALWAQVCSLDESKSYAHLNLGTALTHLRRWSEAERHLLRATELDPSIQSLRRLLNLQMRAQWFEKTEATAERLLHLTPTSGDLYILLAKIHGSRGDDARAIATLRNGRLAAPNDFDVAMIYIESALRNDTTAALAELERLYAEIGADPAKAKRVLRTMTTLRAGAARRAKGLPPETAVSWDDVCRWGDPDGLNRFANELRRAMAQPHTQYSTLGDLAHCAMAELDWDTAEALWQRSREHVVGYITDIVTFDPSFYLGIERMSDTEISHGLAEVTMVRPPPAAAPFTVFLASDPVYFERFTLPLLRTFRRHNSEIHIHAHILDGASEDWQRLTRLALDAAGPTISVSAENSNAKGSKLYYATIRYVRAYQYLNRYRCPLWIMDVDTMINRDPADAFSSIAAFDVALWGCPGWLDPWNKVQASVAGFAPTAAGIAFARLVAAFVVYWRQRGVVRWYTDQLALFAVYAFLDRQRRKPRTLFVDGSLLSTSGDPISAIHINRGVQKYFAGNDEGAESSQETR